MQNWDLVAFGIFFSVGAHFVFGLMGGSVLLSRSVKYSARSSKTWMIPTVKEWHIKRAKFRVSSVF